jgi:hypothetical protein
MSDDVEERGRQVKARQDFTLYASTVMNPDLSCVTLPEDEPPGPFRDQLIRDGLIRI